MEANLNDRNDPGYQGGFREGMNHAYDNWGYQDETSHLRPDNTLPYEDPAVVNPEELATFPKQCVKVDNYHHHHEHESHLVNRRTPVRDGRHITRTDNHPDKDGYI